jgi:serine/threonine protein kinase/Tol biopolymer transport system component
MTLAPGSRLGPYEVIAPLGAGGMGEVYRARDTKLNRNVALKILPEAFASDSDRLARFTREAQTLAALNHPHIAQVYGFDDSGGVQALVMELVEGDDLSVLIAHGPMPLAEALPIARQIAEALEAAHELGIIHRDLKPANIKVREDGTVKVLDFGLAKLADPPAASGAVGVSQSPTITTPAMMTGLGVILGTAAYMSPEQAKGRAADKRSDVWAFGCVLYEMLTGKRAFEGEDVSDTLAAVLRGEPEWTVLPAGLPPAVRRLVQGCLAKDRTQRVGDVAVVRFALNAPVALEPAASAPGASLTPVPTPLWRPVAVVTAVALSVGALATGATWFATRPTVPHVTRMTIATAGPAALTINGNDRDLAITPDGARVVYLGNNGSQLFVRALDALDPVPIASGVLLRGPFVSPNGQWVGFFENNTTLKKVAISGGPAIPLATLDGPSRGATWLPDNTIVVATSNRDTGLQRVSDGGGTPNVVTHPDHTRGESDHLWPEVLPGGRAVLFTIAAQTGGLDAAQIAVLDLRTHTPTILVHGGSHAHYVASGHLVYTAGGTLRAVPFDLGRLAVSGPAVAVVPRVAVTPNGAGDFGVATDGTLVYVDAPGGVAGGARALAWVDRTGKEEPLTAPPRAYVYPRLSPDGTRLALYVTDQQGQDIWVWDLRRATLTPFTFGPGQNSFPVWTLDSRRIVFASQLGGAVNNLWWQAADGTGAAERLTTSPYVQQPTGLSPDGTQVVFNEQTPMRGRDLFLLRLDGTHQIAPLLQTPAEERNGIVSPDGRWVAYEADNSGGRMEIYVRPFPNAASGHWQVSTTGGTKPLWARSGRELFFIGADSALMRVPVEAATTTWNHGAPTKLLEPRYFTGGGNTGRTYDISLDGQRFLMIKSPGGDSPTALPSVIVVQHFDEELKRLVPTR